MVHVFHTRDFGPIWSEVDNSCQVGTNYLVGSKTKMCAKLALLFYESTLLELSDNLSYISEGTPTTESPDKLSGIIRWTQIKLPAKLAESSEQPLS